MLPIILCSIVSISIIAERFWSLRREKVLPVHLVATVWNAVKQDNMSRSDIEALSKESALGTVLSAGLLNRNESRERIKECIEERGREVVHDLERFLNTLGTIASISPLLGLLGTVIGMISVFAAITQHGVGDPGALAGGISEAMITTAAGLTVAIISLNRPDALNALSPNLFIELRAHVDAIANDTDNIGCVILRGNGRSFSAGNDLKAIENGEVAPSRHFQAETLDAIESLPQPVIAAVQGHCYTGSLELALACDLMLVGDDAKLADTHGKWGMSPTWGMSQRLPRRLGPVKAKELMFSGRVVGGEEAVTLGLANACVPSDQLTDEAIKMASGFLANSWFTLRADKMLVNGGADFGLSEGLAFERTNSPGRSPDMEERLKNFGKKS